MPRWLSAATGSARAGERVTVSASRRSFERITELRSVRDARCAAAAHGLRVAIWDMAVEFASESRVATLSSTRDCPMRGSAGVDARGLPCWPFGRSTIN